LSDRILLFVSALALAFLVWNTAVRGIAPEEILNNPAWPERFLLLLCAALFFSAVLQAREAWREGIRRKELPRDTDPGSLEERAFRTEDPTQQLTQHCVRQLDRHFHRLYAFHQYQPPYLAYFYYAKKGSFSLFGLPCMKTGFLLFFLTCYAILSRGEPLAVQGCESALLGMGCLFVISGLLIPVAVSYRKIWLRIVAENNGTCLTLSHFGPSNNHWFEEFCRSLEAHSGVVSCSTQSR
jgi:hypothetical protein